MSATGTRVWLHGACQHARTWDGRVQGLRLNLPGHAGAPRANKDQIAAFADAIEPQLPQNPILLGHSMGGMIAIDLAVRLGERCKALVLIDAPLWILSQPFYRTVAFSAEFARRTTMPQWIAPIIATRLNKRSARPMVRDAIASTPPAVLGDIMQATSAFDARDLLRKITIPTLGIFARSSILTGPLMRRALAALVPSAQIDTVAGSHMLPYDAPDVMHRSIDRFLSTRLKGAA